MDRNSRWAIAGSLTWMFMAVAVVLGTDGRSLLDVDRIGATEPTSEWLSLPAFEVSAPVPQSPGGCSDSEIEAA